MPRLQRLCRRKPLLTVGAAPVVMLVERQHGLGHRQQRLPGKLSVGRVPDVLTQDQDQLDAAGPVVCQVGRLGLGAGPLLERRPTVMGAHLGPPERHRLGEVGPVVAEVRPRAEPLQRQHGGVELEPHAEQVEVSRSQHRPVDQPLVLEPEAGPTPPAEVGVVTVADGKQRPVVLDRERPAAGGCVHEPLQDVRPGHAERRVRLAPGAFLPSVPVAGVMDVSPPASPTARADLEICFRPDTAIDDGRFANNAWLQELPQSHVEAGVGQRRSMMSLRRPRTNLGREESVT